MVNQLDLYTPSAMFHCVHLVPSCMTMLKEPGSCMGSLQADSRYLDLVAAKAGLPSIELSEDYPSKLPYMWR